MIETAFGDSSFFFVIPGQKEGTEKRQQKKLLLDINSNMNYKAGKTNLSFGVSV